MDYKNIANLNYLEPDDTFRFACNCCGQCCKEREDILLSAYDIMRLQGYLDISFEELLLTYCEMYIGKESELPICRLRTEARCPFLLHGKCYVQDAKPTVCALYPLGRMFDGKKVRYFLQKHDCGAGNTEHTLRKWLESLGPDNEKCCILWGNLLTEGTEIIKQIGKTNPEQKKMAQNFMALLMYDKYDSTEDPACQIQIRKDLIKQLPEKLSEISRIEKAGFVKRDAGERM